MLSTQEQNKNLVRSVTGTHPYTDFCSFCHSLTMIDIFMVNLYDRKSGNIDKSDYIALLILSGNAIKGKFVLNYHIPYWAVLILLLVSITLVFSSLLYLLPLAYSQKFYPVSSWVEFGIKQIEFIIAFRHSCRPIVW